MHEPLSPSTKWLAALLTAMVLLSAGRMFVQGLADWASRPARQQLDAWLEKPQSGLQDAEVWRRSVDQLARARQLDPHQAVYPLYEGLAYYVRVRGYAPGSAFDAFAAPYLEQSVQLIRQSRDINPRIGQTLAALAVAKGRQGAFDSEFDNTFELAALHAPFEPVAIAPMLSLGLAAWPRLSEPTRDAVEAMARRAKQVSPGAYASFVKPFLSQGRVCETSPERRFLCQGQP